MDKTIVKVNNLGKEYIIEPTNRYKTLRDSISSLPKKIINFKNKNDTSTRFWALKNVSFDLNKGDALGIIGPNGAGKSTLLKILARITTPTEGHAEVFGKISTMLEVGTGFNPELTGAENVYLNGAIIGMKKKEIDKKFDAIVEYSEIGKFIDVPVKRYSSGMQVRLAFSVAAHLESEVLLLDEILAVGDLSFQRKSLLKMHDIVKNQERTVILVSHNMAAIETLCNKALLLSGGIPMAFGDTNKVISKYVKGVYKDIKITLESKNRSGSGDIRITDFWIENGNGQKTDSPKSGDNCKFIFSYKSNSNLKLKEVDIGFTVKSMSGQPLFTHRASYTNQAQNINKKNGVVSFKFKKFPLTEGRYRLAIYAYIDDKESDFIDEATEINTKAGNFFDTGVSISQKISSMYVEGDWLYEK